MDSFKDSERPPPSYQDLLYSTSSGTAASTIFADHRRAQEERIRRLLSLYVDPLLKNHASSGIAKAVFVLVPSDSVALQSDNPSQSDVIDKLGDFIPGSASNTKETLTSFADDENVRLVRLHGVENSWNFWRQPSVVRELEVELKARYNLQESESKPPVQEQPAPAEKRRLFGRKSSNKPIGVGMFSASGGWSLSSQEQAQPEWGQVSLQIKVEEISIRTVTNIGLFDTRSGQALVMRIHIGG